MPADTRSYRVSRAAPSVSDARTRAPADHGMHIFCVLNPSSSNHAVLGSAIELTVPSRYKLAAPGIVEAFQAINDAPDVNVIILARGGGSLEDLWAFNEEAVARAIYASRAPVVSAIGHETDVTIADMVADLRAPTPSAAAEMIVPDGRELATRVLTAQQALTALVSAYLSTGADQLRELEARLHRTRPDLDTLRLRIDDLLGIAMIHLEHNLQFKIERTQGIRQRLKSLSPQNTLQRGYAIVQKGDDGDVISDASELDAGDVVSVTVSRGIFDAEVTSVHDLK